jgi:hypothetical protein
MQRATRVRAAMLVAAAVLAVVGSARAEDTPGPVPHTAPNDPVICKTFAAPTGSHIGERRICKPVSVWESESRADQALMRDAQSERNQHPDALDPTTHP